MNKSMERNRIIIFVLGITVLVITTVGITYAVYSTQVQNDIVAINNKK